MTAVKFYPANARVKHPGYYSYSDILKGLYPERGCCASVSPRVNIKEEMGSFILELATPGLKKSEISLNVEKDVLKISHKTEGENTEINYSKREFNYAGFEKSFILPESVDVEKISANMDNGILMVNIPKKEEAIDKGPKEIKID
jgi:HSP20 family protein